MKSLVVALLLCVLATFAAKSWLKNTNQIKYLPNQFEAFMRIYQKSYSSPEEKSKRFQIFSENMKIVDKLNDLDENKPYGITKFMDLSPEEFADTYLMKINLTLKSGETATPLAPADLPDNFDWKDNSKCVTAVKDQGQCGSCWTFSAVETIESVCCLGGYALTILSEQQIVDCDHDGGVMGCNGGWPEDVYTYAQTFGGLDTETQYPYHARDQTCQAKKTGFYQCPITSWKYVSKAAGDEDQIQQFVYQISPISIAADAESWQFYKGGVISATSCGKQLDHAIQVTGWKVVNGKKAWTVRNSWGLDWGESGYLYLEYGKNTCGIALHVTVPCVKGTNGTERC